MRLKNMLRLYHFSWFVMCLCVVIGEKSKLKESSKEKFPARITPLLGQTLKTVENNGTQYSVVISDKNLVNANITEHLGEATHVHALGRNNDTDVIETDTWILIMYGSGDFYNTSEHSCIGARRTNVLINCNADVHKPQLKFVGLSEHWKNNGCIYMFELTTCVICPHPADEGLSRGSVFCIIFLTTVVVYLVIGVCYRRLVVGAKGFEQIPHYKFWTRLGNLQADGCNLICRRQEEETWQRLTSNAKDTQEDQDDALLRP